MTQPDIDPIAGNLSAQIEQAAQASYDELLRLIEEGVDPRQAVEQVLATFNGTYITALSEAFSVVMQQRVTPQSVLAMPVGEVFLSARLYDMVQQTQGEVTAIVRQHAQGLHQARQLARQLYDGYDPQGGIKRPLEGTARAYLPKALRELTANPGPRQDLTQLFEQMQQQAGRLKSPALKAGYLEALKAWEQGKGREVLAKRLWVAEREKTRYMADRIAQTELARAYTDKVAGQIMADDSISVVEVRLNPRHPLPDICDLHAKANLWGLGPGLYPKAKAPKPPWHPHCWCRLVTRPDLSAAQAKEREDGAREFLRSLPPGEAARILGNRQRLDLVLGGADWEKVTQAAVRAEYRLRRVGEVGATSMLDNHGMSFDSVSAGKSIVSSLVSAARTAPTDPAQKLQHLWANPKKFEKHVLKRSRDGEIESVQDYAAKTFSVLASAKRMVLVSPVDPNMRVTGKVQVVLDGWVVLLSAEGRVVTSYPFDPSAQTFESRHRSMGDKLYEYEIGKADRKLLEELFGLR